MRPAAGHAHRGRHLDRVSPSSRCSQRHARRCQNGRSHLHDEVLPGSGSADGHTYSRCPHRRADGRCLYGCADRSGRHCHAHGRRHRYANGCGRDGDANRRPADAHPHAS
ncbi:MAG: hypothetical protein NZ528_02630 [Caldilineales bacterium]|nr:hypothetical protein [Caldilineales bacterium]MDW8318359.1 hypothetical protein [Anaerolineae bacterium]